MADRTRDDEDRLLESLLAFEPVADDGFSERVVRRIRRQLWIRRLALPIAMLVGMAIAIRPLLELVSLGSALLGMLPSEWSSLPFDWLPQAPVLLLGGGLSALQGAAVSTGIPFTLVLLAMCYCLYLALKSERLKL